MRARKRTVAGLATLIGVVFGGTAALPVGDAAEPSRPAAGADPAQNLKLVGEATELRTEKSRTFKTADGRLLQQLYTSPVNFRDNGRWRPIDNTLEPGAEGSIRNRANRYSATLPSTLAKPIRVTEGSDAVSFKLRGASGTRRTSEATATYEDALPQVDVRYDLLPHALKETVILTGPEAQREFRFDVASGLRGRETASGGVEFVDSAGDVQFTVPAPVAWDAANDAPVDEVAALRYDAENETLTLRVSDRYLDDPARKFPVSVDPMLAVASPAKDCKISAAASEQSMSFCAYDTLRVGWVEGHNNHSLLHFDAANQIPRNVTVLESWVSTYKRYQSDVSWGHQYTMNSVTRPWADGQTTWLKANSTTNWATPGGDFSSTPLMRREIGGGGPAAWMYWAIPDLAQRWADRTEADNGVIIRPDTTTPTSGVVFSSGNDVDPAKRPKLNVLYEPAVGLEGPFNHVFETVGDIRAGVNVASGDLNIREKDAGVTTSAPAVSLERFYNNADQHWGRLGKGWQIGISQLRAAGNGDVSVEMPTGTWARFPQRSDGTFDAANRLLEPASISLVGAEYRLELPDRGERWVFNLDGRMLRREQIGTTAKVSYTYNADGSLQKITDTNLGNTYFSYNTDGNLTSAALPDGRVVSYVVTGEKMRSRTLGTATSNYTYDATGNLTRVSAPAGTIKFVYDTQKRVTSMTRVTNATADTGPTTTFAYYDRASLGTCPPESAGRTVETMPDAKTVQYCYDARLAILDILEASTSTGESPALQDLVVSEYAEHYGVTPAVAKTAVETSDKSLGLGQAIGTTSADVGYAGVWFDNGQQRVKVGLVSGTDPAPVQQLLADRGLTGSSDIVQVQWTQRELELERDRLMTVLSDLDQARLLSASVRESANDVLLETGSAMTSTDRARVASAAASSPRKATVVAVAQSHFAVNDFACNRRQCDAPLRGGMALYLNGGDFIRCTTAFSARKNGVPVMLTAGHCRPSFDDADGEVDVKDGDGDHHTIGVFDTTPYINTQGDFGYIPITQGSGREYASPAPWVLVEETKTQGDYQRDGGRTRYTPRYRIKGVAPHVVGAPVCISGALSGTKCGLVNKTKIRQENQTFRIAEVQIYNCRENDNSEKGEKLKMGGGDSGAPSYKYRLAHGILQGGRDSTPSDKTDQKNKSCFVYISGAGEAQTVLGLTIERTSN